MEKAIYWFTRNHVAGNFLMVIIMALGVKTWFGLKKEIFPETSIDTIAVRVPYPNATPEEVEKGVVVPIEESIQDLSGIDRIRSTSAQGMGVVLVEVASGSDVRAVMDDVKTRVDAIQNLAEDAETPTLEELVLKSQVMSVAVSADTDEKTLRRIAETVRDGLLAWGGGATKISQAQLAGVRNYEISIEVSEQTLRKYGLTFDEVAAAVRRSSLDLPGGSVRTQGGELLIRTESRRYTAPEFAPITVVTRADGSVVTLGEIAMIRDEFEETDLESRFDGRRAMLINVFRVGDEDTLKVASTVKQFVAEAAPRMVPEGVSLEIWKDDSVLLDGRMKLLGKNALFGLLLVTGVLALFLRPSLAVLVAIGIPVSFAGAVWTMPFLDVSINMISLFAFILVLGIVVDDAIVIGENVYSRIRRGEDPHHAAPAGTHEVGVVVIFGVLTTMVAFTPMLGLSGVSGKIWPNIPWIVIPTLAFSLLQSKFVLPSHLALLRPYDPHQRPGPILRFQRLFSRGLERFIETTYRPALNWALDYRYVVICGFVAVLAAVMTAVSSGWVKFQFFPEVEADAVTAKLTLPKGVPFEETQRGVAQLERAAFELNDHFQDRDGNPILRHLLASAGTQPFQVGFDAVAGVPSATNLGEVTIELQPSANRDVSGQEIVSKWRELTGAIPGAVELSFRTEAAGGGNAIDLELSGPNLAELEAATEEVKAALASFDGVIDIADSNLDGKRELKLRILPGAEALGLRLEDVARQVRQGFYGDEIQRLQRGRNEVKVFVRYPRDERRSLADLANMKIRTPAGAELPFGEVAVAEFGRSYSTIERANRQRTIRITADVDKAKGTNANEVVAALTRTGAAEESTRSQWVKNIRQTLGLPVEEAAVDADTAPGALAMIRERFPSVQYSFEGEQKDQRESVQQIGTKFLIALLLMYVLMAVPLKSYIQPVIVMSVIPFGLVGAVLGHVLMGWLMDPSLGTLSIMSMCGIVALAGVVVNDSLVLVDYVNRHRDSAGSVVEAARAAGVRRFRPILLTSLTTFAGLTPMLLETDIQALFLVPMAISLSFGILFATVITLFLVPCVYLILEDGRRRLGLEWPKPAMDAPHGEAAAGNVA
ncbi:MAG: efflux RND transporter permease subunit [Verrucomicrobiales bacterium]|nr:efflux RND transporter permease subunit [Verrucomicrobiales bacterium]